MYLPKPFIKIAEYDSTLLIHWVQNELIPKFCHSNAQEWSDVQKNTQLIGKENTDSSFAFRKMQPSNYLQLYLINDEIPSAPWALPLTNSLKSQPIIQEEIKKINQLCRECYGPGELGFLGFAILGPHGQIPLHRDMGHDMFKKLFSHHLHLPLTEVHNSLFTIKEQSFKFSPNFVYEINNILPHSVLNESDQYRINLMIDYCPQSNLWMRELPSPKFSMIKLYYRMMFGIEL